MLFFIETLTYGDHFKTVKNKILKRSGILFKPRQVIHYCYNGNLASGSIVKIKMKALKR